MFLGLAPEYREQLGNLTVGYSVKTEWQLHDACLPGFYGPAQAIFRDTGCLPNMLAAAGAAERKPQYFMFNTVDDDISPIELKRHQLGNLNKAGITASLKEITAEEAGGELFRSMSHADAPMQKLFAHAFDRFSVGTTTLDRYRSTEIAFACFDKLYTVIHSDKPPYVEMRIEQQPDY
jgi:hypothetical protein